jgi:hypothetical protein
MRQQHNAGGSDGGRNCWKTARERNRMKARFAIRHRIKKTTTNENENENIKTRRHPGKSVDPAATAVDSCYPVSDTNNVDSNKEQIQNILNRIVEGDRSFFSLQYMEEHHDLLSSPIPTEYMWQPDTVNNNNNLLIGEQKLLSWFLHTGLDTFRQFLSSLDTFTFTEYAIWLR